MLVHLTVCACLDALDWCNDGYVIECFFCNYLIDVFFMIGFARRFYIFVLPMVVWNWVSGVVNRWMSELNE